MRKLLNRKRGFTLIELMIVVAIIGILAAIAIPNFLRFQLRSKAGEARVNLAGIRTAEESYFAEYGIYIAETAGVPATGGTNQKVAWTTGTAFDTLGWAPEGSVFYQYGVAINGASTDYTAEAVADLDGDGTFSDFVYVHPIPGSTSGSAAPGLGDGNCANTGAYNANGGLQDLLNAVGACEAMDGQAEF